MVNYDTGLSYMFSADISADFNQVAVVCSKKTTDSWSLIAEWNITMTYAKSSKYLHAKTSGDNPPIFSNYIHYPKYLLTALTGDMFGIFGGYAERTVLDVHLFINQITAADDGVYMCLLSDQCGSVSTTFTVKLGRKFPASFPCF